MTTTTSGKEPASSSSSPSSPSASRCSGSYHVFLSFRGEDTRWTFVDHLYTALTNAGFRTFRDDDEIQRGESIKVELRRAIEESRVSIVVFSRNYASSSWCLDELAMILGRRRRGDSGHVVLPVFYGVDPSDVRKQKGVYAEAFARHEERFKFEVREGEAAKGWKEKLKGWREALEGVAGLKGMALLDGGDRYDAKFIQKIIKVVEDKLGRPRLLNVTTYLVGLDSRAKSINLWLQDGGVDVGIIVICGMGGIGKTTIAKFVYNLNFSKFEGNSFIANIREICGQQNSLIRLQSQLLSDILGRKEEEIRNVDEGILKIKEAISFKRVLIVLDDVDKREQLDSILGTMDWLSPGSKLIITTRYERLLRVHECWKVYEVEELDHDESLQLFSWYAFGQSHPINGYLIDSEKAVEYCRGLPLALKILGSSLSGENLDVWKSRLRSSLWNHKDSFSENLKKLPQTIYRLNSLATGYISRCLKLKNFSAELGNMNSLSRDKEPMTVGNRPGMGSKDCVFEGQDSMALEVNNPLFGSRVQLDDSLVHRRSDSLVEVDMQSRWESIIAIEGIGKVQKVLAAKSIEIEEDNRQSEFCGQNQATRVSGGYSRVNPHITRLTSGQDRRVSQANPLEGIVHGKGNVVDNQKKIMQVGQQNAETVRQGEITGGNEEWPRSPVIQPTNNMAGSKPSWASLLESSGPRIPLKLDYVPPQVLESVIPRVHLPTDVIEEGSMYWMNTLVGYFVEKRLTFPVVQSIATELWKRHGLNEVLSNNSGFYFFRFDTQDQTMGVFDAGPWHFEGCPLLLRCWEPGMLLSQDSHTSVPLWVKIFDVPLEGWTIKGLSIIARTLGRPIHVELMMGDKTRLGCARVCVEVHVSSSFPKFIELHQGLDEFTSEPKVAKLPVEYQWVPSVCTHCHVFGHPLSRCPRQPYQFQGDKNNAVHKPILEKSNIEGNDNRGPQPIEKNKGKGVESIKRMEVGESSRHIRRESTPMSIIDVIERASRPIQIAPVKVGSLMANRFCSLMQEDMDIPSPRELILPIEGGSLDEIGMDLEEIGTRGRVADDASESERTDSSSSGSIVKSKSQLKREKRKKHAIEKAIKASQIRHPKNSDPVIKDPA